MLLGTIDVRGGYLHSHKASFSLLHEIHFVVRQPFIAPGVAIASFLTSFTLVFGDLMHLFELGVFVCLATLMVAAGLLVARLELINKELHRAETSTLVWGTYWHLNRIRRDLANSASSKNAGGRS